LQKRFEREQAERQATASEQQARRWMNEAVQAFRAKNWKQAEALSQGAYAVGGATSYLAQDALLLQARAADNQNNPVAHQLFARLAETYRQSEYAPVALLLAAQSANRHGNKAKANEYANRLRQRYAASPEARRLGSGQ
jgi:TolA-binding protein